MPPSRSRRPIAVLALTALLLLLAGASGAAAHVERISGPFLVSLGWADEPALSGYENFVEVTVTDRSGAPVGGQGTDLQADVSFGQAAITVPLLPADRPGVYRGVIVPTRPGTYGFHVTGTAKGRAVDVAATCSERTFDCVIDGADVQFPVKDPTSGQVAQRLARVLPRETRGSDTGATARGIAIGAVAVAALVLLGVFLRRRRKQA